MDLIVINNTSSAHIQSYVELSNDSDNKNPKMDELSREHIIVTGNIPADVRLSSEGTFIYLGIWTQESNSIDSWVVINRETNTVDDFNFDNFSIDVKHDEYQITASVSNHTADKKSISTGVIIAIIALIIFFIIAGIAWFIFR